MKKKEFQERFRTKLDKAKISKDARVDELEKLIELL